MQRNQHDELSRWIARENRKPLIIRGARQVGKSTLVRMFASKIDKRLLEVNLERHPQLDSTFESRDTNIILNTIESLFAIQPDSNDFLLFLDEIQAVPAAIVSLRYFYEDRPEIPVITAGSLFDFALSNHQLTMPVGRVEYMHMGPATFCEFLQAVGEKKLSDFILTYEPDKRIEDLIHTRMLNLLTLYFFVGGMPEAIDVYARHRRLQDTQAVLHSILEAYQDDFPKYVGGSRLQRFLHIFTTSGSSVGRKVKYSNYSNDVRGSAIKKDLEMLCAARLLSKVVHSNCNGIPIHADRNPKFFKLLFLDVGLMNALCGLEWSHIQQMDSGRLINNGPIAEQFIGQHLQNLFVSRFPRELHYWAREGRSNNAEVDYVVSSGSSIIPIEVKAGSKGRLRSLNQFMAEKSSKFAIRFDLNKPSIQDIQARVTTGSTTKGVDYPLYSLPLYLVEALPRLLTSMP